MVDGEAVDGHQVVPRAEQDRGVGIGHGVAAQVGRQDRQFRSEHDPDRVDARSPVLGRDLGEVRVGVGAGPCFAVNRLVL